MKISDKENGLRPREAHRKYPDPTALVERHLFRYQKRSLDVNGHGLVQ